MIAVNNHFLILIILLRSIFNFCSFFIVFSNPLNIPHILGFSIACGNLIDQCQKRPYDQCNGEHIVSIKCSIESHIINLYSEYHINLRIPSVGWE